MNMRTQFSSCYFMSLDRSEVVVEHVHVSDSVITDGHHPFYIESLSSKLSIIHSEFDNIDCLYCSLIEARDSDLHLEDSIF